MRHNNMNVKKKTFQIHFTTLTELAAKYFLPLMPSLLHQNTFTKIDIGRQNHWLVEEHDRGSSFPRNPLALLQKTRSNFRRNLWRNKRRQNGITVYSKGY